MHSDQRDEHIYDIGGVFHVYPKGVQDTPYQALNFQRKVLGSTGLLHDCEGVPMQDAVLDLLLGYHKVQMLVATGGDGTLGKVTTSARKALASQSVGPKSRSIDDILVLLNRAGTQNVHADYYGLPEDWRLSFASAVSSYLEQGPESLVVHRVPQFRVMTRFVRDGALSLREDYGGMFIGASLNRFMNEHYRIASKVGPLPHSFADLGIIVHGVFQPSYARSLLKPVKGAIYVDGKQLPVDGWNYILVFSNDWKIDMKILKLDPCEKLRNFRRLTGRSDGLQVVVGTATVPKVVHSMVRFARGRSFEPRGFLMELGHDVRIESDERQFNLEGDPHPSGEVVEIDSGYYFNMVGDHSRKYLEQKFGGDLSLFRKFADDLSKS